MGIESGEGMSRRRAQLEGSGASVAEGSTRGTKSAQANVQRQKYSKNSQAAVEYVASPRPLSLMAYALLSAPHQHDLYQCILNTAHFDTTGITPFIQHHRIYDSLNKRLGKWWISDGLCAPVVMAHA